MSGLQREGGTGAGGDGALGGDGQALSFGDRGGELTVPGGQFLDPAGGFR